MSEHKTAGDGIHPRVMAGEVVKRERQRLYVNQTEAARAGGTSVPSWRKVEQGADDVSENTLAAVDRAIGWPIGTTRDLRIGRVYVGGTRSDGAAIIHDYHEKGIIHGRPSAEPEPEIAAEQPGHWDGRLAQLPREDREAIEAVIETYERRRGLRP